MKFITRTEGRSKQAVLRLMYVQTKGFLAISTNAVKESIFEATLCWQVGLRVCSYDTAGSLKSA